MMGSPWRALIFQLPSAFRYHGVQDVWISNVDHAGHFRLTHINRQAGPCGHFLARLPMSAAFSKERLRGDLK